MPKSNELSLISFICAVLIAVGFLIGWYAAKENIETDEPKQIHAQYLYDIERS